MNFRAHIFLEQTCAIDWYVHEGAAVTGPWTTIWSGQTRASGSGEHLSGPIRLVTTPGRYYSLSFAVPSPCPGAGYGFTNTGSTDAGFGTKAGFTFDNGYTGYSPTYVPPDSGATIDAFYGPHVITLR